MGDTDYIGKIVQEESDLDHSGVKGMRWGVRKDGRGKFRRGATKASVALDAGAKVIKEGEKKLIFLPRENRQRAAGRTQNRVLGLAMTLNKSPEFKGQDLKSNPALRKRYFNTIEKRAAKIYAEELDISRDDAWREVLNVSKSDNSVVVRALKDQIEHSSDSDPYVTLLTLNFEMDENGQVIGVKADSADDSIEHGELMHYGTKGMKWGVRKDRGSSEPKPITAPPKGPKNETSAEKYVRLTNHAKKHGANSLDDDDLSFVTRRGNAINQINRLNERKPGWAAELAKEALKTAVKQRLNSVSNEAGKKYIDAPLSDAINSKSDK